MKKTTMLLALFITALSLAQTMPQIDSVRVVSKRDAAFDSYFTASIGVDPGATINSQGVDVIVELEFVDRFYAKVGVEHHSGLTPKYNDLHVGAGGNFFLNRFRIYAGLRGMVILRESKHKKAYGFEAGIDYEITDKLFLGLRSAYDYRADFELAGTDPEYRFNGWFRIGYIFY